MTVDERFEQLERKTQRLEKRNKRLTVALTMTVVAMCAAVTMAATNVRDVSNSEIGRFEFHRDQRPDGFNRSQSWPDRWHYLLDTKTGEIWEIANRERKPVTLKR